MQIRQRHFGRGDEIVVPGGHLEEVFFKFGQLACAGHGSAVDHEGRADFDIVLVQGMLIEKEVDQRAIQTCRPALIHHKAAAGQFGGAVKVQTAQGRAHFPVLSGREIKLARRAPAQALGVFRFVFAHGGAFVGNVGDAHEPFFHSGPGCGGLGIQRLDAVGQFAQFRHHVGGVLALALELGNLAGGGILFLLQGFHFSQQGTATTVQLEKFVHAQGRMAVGKGLCQQFGIFLHQFEVNHEFVLLRHFLSDQRSAATPDRH